MKDSHKNQQGVSRREALKTILGMGGALTVLRLPETWEAPIIETGMLPPLAQISQPQVSTPFALSNLSRTLVALNNCPTGNATGSSFDLSFDYVDPEGKVTSQATIVYVASLPGADPQISLTDPSVTRTGDASQGKITIRFCTYFGSSNSITETVTLINADSKGTDPLTLTTPKPIGAQEQTTESGSQSLG